MTTFNLFKSANKATAKNETNINPLNSNTMTNTNSYINKLYTHSAGNNTENNNIQEPNAKEIPQRISMAEYGFEQAGFAAGSEENFLLHLDLIKNGHFIDADHLQNSKKSEILAIIHQKHDEEAAITQYKIDIENLRNSELELKRKQRNYVQDAIDEQKSMQAEQEEATEFSKIKMVQFIFFGTVFLLGGMVIYSLMLNLLLFGNVDINQR